MTFPKFGIISNHLAICLSSELILHLHHSGDGRVVVYRGGGGGRARPDVVSTCFLYYQLINLRK